MSMTEFDFLRLNGPPKGFATSEYFFGAANSTIHAQIAKKKYFTAAMQISKQKALDLPNQALFTGSHTIEQDADFEKMVNHNQLIKYHIQTNLSFFQFQIIWKSNSRMYPYAFGVTKGFPFRPFMNREIIKLREKGFIQHELTRVKTKKYTKPKEDLQPISIKKVIAPFAILSISFMLSLLFLVCELFSFKFVSSHL